MSFVKQPVDDAHSGPKLVAGEFDVQALEDRAQAIERDTVSEAAFEDGD
jgi:hypothetical protein